MRDHAASLADTLASKGEKPLRGGALPLRIARRKMRSNIAVGESTKYRIDQRVERDIGVGMTGHAARMRDLNSGKHHMIALGECMHVKTIAGPHVRKSRKPRDLGAGKIICRRHFQVGGFPFKNADTLTRPFG